MFYSPLRYPGGKGKLTPLVRYLIEKVNTENPVYIEPFAGGAGVALELLLEGTVETIVINDYDKAIASFWKAILNEPNRFVDMIYNVPVTVNEWKRQKEIYLSSPNRYSFELGFATFFLNRTNRSGIIKGGIIGGANQEGKWKIDARFNKDELIKRILRISEFKKNIVVYNKDAISLIKNYMPKYGPDAFAYFDPPYFEKGKALYKNYYDYLDHRCIEKHIREYVDCNWIITYDNVPEIWSIYKEFLIKEFSINYSAADKRKASELMIFKNSMLCPTNEELKENKIDFF